MVLNTFRAETREFPIIAIEFALLEIISFVSKCGISASAAKNQAMNIFLTSYPIRHEDLEQAFI